MFVRVMPKVAIKFLKLIIDGGNVVKCGDTIVMTEKVFYENKEYSREDIVEMLHYAFECDIMFPEEEFDRFYIESILPPVHDCPF